MDAKDQTMAPSDAGSEVPKEEGRGQGSLATGGKSLDMLWRIASGGGVVGVLAAALIVYQSITAATQEQAKASVELELRLRAIESQLVVLPEIRAELKAFSAKPFVTVRDFNRWKAETRRTNPTMTIPDFDPAD
jgi:hypothetical protein